MSVNKVILIGRLGKDPELRHTPSGAAVCNFSLATNETWVDKSGAKQDRTEWHHIVVWGKLAEVCTKFLKKGKQAFIEGKLQTRQFEDKNGAQRQVTEVLTSNVRFLSQDAGEAAQSSSDDFEPGMFG